MVSAVHPQEYDLPQLRDMVGQQKRVQEVDKSKQAAARQQGSSVLGWIRRQNLPEQAERLARLQQDAEEMVNERLGIPLLERWGRAMLDDPRHRMGGLGGWLKQRAARG